MRSLDFRRNVWNQTGVFLVITPITFSQYIMRKTFEWFGIKKFLIENSKGVDNFMIYEILLNPLTICSV